MLPRPARAADYTEGSRAGERGGTYGILMETFSFIEDLQQRIGTLLSGTPAADVQRNLKALLTQQFARLDLVTREEFEIQRDLLAKAREKVDALEAKIAQLSQR